MDSSAVLTHWAQLQSERELTLLRLAMAYHMHKSGLTEMTLSTGDITAMVNLYHCGITLDVSGQMKFTLSPRNPAPAGPSA